MKNEYFKKFTLTKLLLLLIVTYAHSQEYRGRVVGISDGDTFTLLTEDKKQVKVRLSEIDTPETAQPFGTKAKQTLSDLVFGKDVVVIKADTDRYGRIVGHVYVNEVHVNRRLVYDGMAWAYRQYLKDKTLLQDEQKAREAKRGLWSLPSTEQLPPWEWRRNNKTSNPKEDSDPNNGPDRSSKQKFKCDSKTRCSEMISCEEAIFYLNECGLSQIDGDKDGIPCESLCK